MRHSITFPLLALVLAAVAAFAVNSALRSKDQALRVTDQRLSQALSQTAVILVAARDLPVGTKLTADCVKFAQWPRGILPEGAARQFSAVAGSIVRSAFFANEPIVGGKLISSDMKSGLLPLLIPPNMRAMSVEVDEVGDIAGFVLPHTRVDIIATYAGAGGEGSARAQVVLDNVEVLAVAQHIEKDQPQVERVVTFLVTPREAERLALVSRTASLRLALRGYGDEQRVRSDGVTVSEVFGSRDPRPSVHPASASGHRPATNAVAVQGFKVEVLRDGTSRESLTFDRAGGRLVASSRSESAARKPLAAATSVGDAAGQAAAMSLDDKSGAYANNNPE